MVDSIDRERLAITKEELYRMLAHEVNFESKRKQWSKVSVCWFCFFTKMICFAVGYFIISKMLYFDGRLEVKKFHYVFRFENNSAHSFVAYYCY